MLYMYMYIDLRQSLRIGKSYFEWLDAKSRFHCSQVTGYSRSSTAGIGTFHRPHWTNSYSFTFPFLVYISVPPPSEHHRNLTNAKMRTRTLTKTEDSAVTTVQAPCFMGITVEIRQEILILATALHEICPKDLSSHYSFNRVRGNGTSTIQSLLLVNHRIRTEMLHVVQKRRRQVEKQLSLFIDIPNNDSGWRKFKKYRESFCCPIFPYEVFEFCDFTAYLNYRDWLVRHAEWLLRCTVSHT